MRQPDQPLLRPVVDVAFEPAQRGRLGGHRGDGLRPGGVPLLLQPPDPAEQRGHVPQQHLPKPGLGGDARPGHQRQGDSSSRPSVIAKARCKPGDPSPRLRAMWDPGAADHGVLRPGVGWVRSGNVMAATPTNHHSAVTTEVIRTTGSTATACAASSHSPGPDGGCPSVSAAGPRSSAPAVSARSLAIRHRSRPADQRASARPPAAPRPPGSRTGRPAHSRRAPAAGRPGGHRRGEQVQRLHQGPAPGAEEEPGTRPPPAPRPRRGTTRPWPQPNPAGRPGRPVAVRTSLPGGKAITQGTASTAMTWALMDSPPSPWMAPAAAPPRPRRPRRERHPRRDPRRPGRERAAARPAPP